jgi:RNA polymerase sigma-70 factor (ECF subfamily)
VTAGPPPGPHAIAAIAAGDRAALRALYDEHYPWLNARLRRRCGDPGVVEEAIQDTFMAVWRNAATWTGKGDLGAWI